MPVRFSFVCSCTFKCGWSREEGEALGLALEDGRWREIRKERGIKGGCRSFLCTCRRLFLFCRLKRTEGAKRRHWLGWVLAQFGFGPSGRERRKEKLAVGPFRCEKNIDGLNIGKREERNTVHGNLVQSLREGNKLIFLRGKSSNEKEAQTKYHELRNRRKHRLAYLNMLKTKIKPN